MARCLRLACDPELVPFLGLWVDEGGFNACSTVALEPSTGFYDSLSRAWENQQVIQVPPGGTYRWYIDIEIGKVVQ